MLETASVRGSGQRILASSQIIGLAYGAKPSNLGKAMPNYPDLVLEFLDLLRERQIPFVVVGGIALLNYVSGRNTDGIDLILSAPRLRDLPEVVIREQNQMFAFGQFEALRVDFLFLEHPLFEIVSRQFSKPLEYDIGILPTATIEGLLILKLFALRSLYRQWTWTASRCMRRISCNFCPALLPRILFSWSY
jgi:hypothetical protein